MTKHIPAVIVTFVITLVGIKGIGDPMAALDLLVGWVYLLPNMLLHELPDLVSPICTIIPMFVLLPFIFLFAAGLLALREID